MKHVTDDSKHVTTTVASDINAMARALAQVKRQTLAQFLSEVITTEVDRRWHKKPEGEDVMRKVVREELARAFE